ncbi:MAG TPA: serine hydrolase domain-containing protein [Actinomycetota bacterium]|jgi:CubicO group peptidase (beta-lactamase class C family)|nr:serine hydrolase domain-containing protein [Actinomycetota bacterium]
MIVAVRPEDLGFDSERLERVADLCHWYVDEGKLPGTSVIVARRGEIVFRDVYGMADIESGRKLEDDTIFRIYSMTKPIASIALMQLVEKGEVLLHNPVSRYIPSFAGASVYVSGAPDDYTTEEPSRPVTIHDILTHTSGLSTGFQPGTVGSIYRKAGLGFGFRELNLEEYCDTLASLPLAFHPGTKWLYSAATDVVGRVVEVVSGRALDVYLEENIFGPLGMTDTAFWVPEDKHDRFAQCYTRENKELKPFPGSYLKPPKLLSGAGGLVGTIDDYQRFVTALVRGGELNGKRIIGRKTLDYMTMNHLPGGVDLQTMGGEGASETAMPGVGFGLGFGVVIDPPANRSLASHGEYMWGGAASTTFWVDPLEEVTVVMMTQLFPSGSFPIRPQLRWVVNAALVDSAG